MADFNTYMQTAAAISSAVAAVFAAVITKNAFRFQKSAILKQAVLNEITSAVGELQFLLSLTDQQPLAVSDEVVSTLPQRMSGVVSSITKLQSMTTMSAQADIKKVHEIISKLDDAAIFSQESESAARLREAINLLERIYSMEVR